MSETAMTGLLCMSEPHGGFLRVNDSSRTAGIHTTPARSLHARSLTDAALQVIDAEPIEHAIAGAPVAGMTVITFANNHLPYALI